MRSLLLRRVVVAVLLLGLANTSCAATTIMVTDYERRTPSQYRLLWIDLAVVGVTTGVGAPLYALSDKDTVGERVGLGMLIGAGLWAAWTLFGIALLGMPGQPAASGIIIGRAPHGARGRPTLW